MIMLVIVILACGVHVFGTLCATAPANEYGIAETTAPTGIAGTVAAGALATLALIANASL